MATEGPHDQAAISRLLLLLGLKRFSGRSKDLDPFWEGFVPKYPKRGNLYARMDMPSIFTSQMHSVAIYCGEGSNLVSNLIAITKNQPRYAQEISAFGLIVDADTKLPELVAREKAKALQSVFPTLSEIPGNVVIGTPRTGIYIFPDNKRSGSLDSILLECASIAYPDHKAGATRFLNNLDIRYTKKLNAAAKCKAVVACIVSVLRPGLTNTTSIVQDEWISEKTLANSEIASFLEFLKDLLDLSCL